MNNKIKNILKKYFSPFVKLRNNYKNRFLDDKWCEKMCEFGSENPEITFYICRRRSDKVGLFSNVLVFLEQINDAKKNGFYPVIDMQNYANIYLTKDTMGTKNAWEYYFEQPVNNEISYSLNQVYKSKNVILSDGGRGKNKQIDFSANFPMSRDFKMWRELYRKTIKLNKETEILIDAEYNRLFSKNDHVLGIYTRGTDYRILQPYGHPIQPEIKDVFKKTKKVLKEWNCNKIFLCTESSEILSQFEEEFPGKIVTNKREFYSNTKKDEYVTIKSFERENDEYLKGLEYLTSIVILSRCHSLLASFASGLTATLLMSDGFENTYFWNLGLYGIDN